MIATLEKLRLKKQNQKYPVLSFINIFLFFAQILLTVQAHLQG